MKFYFLVSSILLGVTARTRTATADESLSCDDQDELRSQFPDCSCVTKCPNEAAQCLPEIWQHIQGSGCDATCQGGQACPITHNTFSCDDQDELRSQFPGCSCVIKCPNGAATCLDGSSAEQGGFHVEPIRKSIFGCDIAPCDGGRVCPITTTTDTTGGFDGSVPAGETLSCAKDQDELRSQFPDCSCLDMCPNEAPRCNDACVSFDSCLLCGLSSNTYHTDIHDAMMNDDDTGSGAGILSSASSTYIGASVAIIAIFV